MSDNVPPYQYWRQTKNPEYQWDPWKDDEIKPDFQSYGHLEESGPNLSAPLPPQDGCNSPMDMIHNKHLLQSQVITPQHMDQDWGTIVDTTPLPVCNQVIQQPIPSVSGDRHFTFESGCRPLEPSASAGKHDDHATSPPDTRLKCEHPGCTSKRRFTRKYELQRHMKKHAPPVAYPCPVIGCAYQGARSFYRSDKLKIHLRMSHAEEALCKCPVQGCPSVQLPLGLIYYHADFHQQGDHQTIPVLSQYQKNGSKRVARCPIGNSNECGKWIATTQMPSHLLSHSEDDRLKFRTDTLQAGYDSITGQPICPICFQPFSNPEEFARHIHLRHLLEPGSEGAEHVSKLYNTLVEHLDRNRILTWTDLWNFPSYILRNEDLNCLFCGLLIYEEHYPRFRSFDDHTNVTNHIRDHLKIHKEDITEVIQHRRQILKHYPNFINHPIFDDVRVTSTAPPTTGSL